MAKAKPLPMATRRPSMPIQLALAGGSSESTPDTFRLERHLTRRELAFNPFPARIQYTGSGARLSRERLPSTIPIKPTTAF